MMKFCNNHTRRLKKLPLYLEVILLVNLAIIVCLLIM